MSDIEKIRELEQLRFIANVMDSSISIFGFRFGLDALIGLLPVAGDTIGGLISMYLLWRSYKLGLPAREINLLLLYILADVFIGTIPIVGDLFDFFFKVNDRILERLERTLKTT